MLKKPADAGYHIFHGFDDAETHGIHSYDYLFKINGLQTRFFTGNMDEIPLRFNGPKQASTIGGKCELCANDTTYICGCSGEQFTPGIDARPAFRRLKPSKVCATKLRILCRSSSFFRSSLRFDSTGDLNMSGSMPQVFPNRVQVEIRPFAITPADTAARRRLMNLFADATISKDMTATRMGRELTRALALSSPEFKALVRPTAIAAMSRRQL